ncbi:MAG: hypothetical protein EOO41_01490 [Methanobacteriota archaeon]|nr:MAG: hypothetical protein EOO41_01490 [Euryarchaeota archaeon]
MYLTVLRKVDPKSQTSIVMRITLTYLQMLGTLGIFKARGTATFRAVLGAADSVSTSILSSSPVACLLRPTFYMQFGTMMCLPIIAAVLGVLIKAAYTFFRSRTCGEVRNYLARRGYVAPAVVVLYAAYPMLVAQAFRALNCRPQAVAGTKYLQVDLSVECWTGKHVIAAACAGVALVLFGLGIPLAIVRLLRKRQHKLHRVEVFGQFGFLYNGYDIQRGTYWWEALILTRKAAIVLLGSLVADEYIATFAAILVTFGALCAHAAFQPFLAPLFNLLEGATLMALCTTQIICVLYLRTEQLAEASNARTNVAADASITAVLLLLNLGTLLLLVGVGTRLAVQQHHAKLERAMQRWPWLAAFCASRPGLALKQCCMARDVGKLPVMTLSASVRRLARFSGAMQASDAGLQPAALAAHSAPTLDTYAQEAMVAAPSARAHGMHHAVVYGSGVVEPTPAVAMSVGGPLHASKVYFPTSRPTLRTTMSRVLPANNVMASSAIAPHSWTVSNPLCTAGGGGGGMVELTSFTSPHHTDEASKSEVHGTQQLGTDASSVHRAAFDASPTQ